MKTTNFLQLFLLLFLSSQVLGNITPTFENEDYTGNGNVRQYLDVYVPPNITDARPAVVYIHGGGWKGGDKGTKLRDDLLRLYTNQQFVIVAINYRYSYVFETETSTPHPAQIHDCKAAIRYLRANHETFDIDPCAIGVMGHSSGGHLAALLGTSAEVPSLEGGDLGNDQYSSAVQAVISFFPPTDFLNENWFDCTTPYNMQNPIGLYAQFIACPPLTCPQNTISPNPITHIDGNEPPFLLYHGTIDCTVPFGHSVALNTALQNQGIPCEFQVSEHGHGDPYFYTDQTILENIESFFAKELVYCSQACNAVDICATLTANPASPLATLDCDHGGIDNQTECAAGYDPTDATNDCSAAVNSNTNICDLIRVGTTPVTLVSDTDVFVGHQDTESFNDNNVYTFLDETTPEISLLSHISLEIYFRVEYASCENEIELRVTDPTGEVVYLDTPFSTCEGSGPTPYPGALYHTTIQIPTGSTNKHTPWQVEFRDTNDQNPNSNEYTARFGRLSYLTRINPHPLENQDCDGGGVDNITECQLGLNPAIAEDDCEVNPPCTDDCTLNFTVMEGANFNNCYGTVYFQFQLLNNVNPSDIVIVVKKSSGDFTEDIPLPAIFSPGNTKFADEGNGLYSVNGVGHLSWSIIDRTVADDCPNAFLINIEPQSSCNCPGCFPSCGDGVQNGFETGVDCGGYCLDCLSCDGLEMVTSNTCRSNVLIEYKVTDISKLELTSNDGNSQQFNAEWWYHQVVEPLDPSHILRTIFYWYDDQGDRVYVIGNHPSIIGWTFTYDGVECAHFDINENCRISIDSKEPDKQGFTVFPNPTSNWITIQASVPSPVMIYNSQGRLVKQITVHLKRKVDLSELGPGIYFIKNTKTNQVIKLLMANE